LRIPTIEPDVEISRIRSNKTSRVRFEVRRHLRVHADRNELSSWLVAVPGVERQPLKKLALLKLHNRARGEAEKAGRKVERIAVAFEAGRDGSGWRIGSEAQVESTPRG
jgi:hypothetical protein